MSSKVVQNTVLEPGADIKANVSESEAQFLLRDLYGLHGGSLQSLLAYDDFNFKYTGVTDNTNPEISTVWPHGYVLKIINSWDSQNRALTEGQNAIMLFLREHGIGSPIPVKNLSGQYYSVVKLPLDVKENQKEHIVKLLEFQPGAILSSLPGSYSLCFEVGVFIANLNNILKEFRHPVYDNYKSVWHLDSAPKIISFLSSVKDDKRRDMVKEVIGEFNTKVMANRDVFEKGMLHGDFNEHNIVMRRAQDGGKWKISSVLDFGDCSHSCYLFELAITMCYMMFECQRNNLDPLKGSGHVLSGYKTLRSVTEHEENLLKLCICTRLCQSLVMGIYTNTLHPDNTYIMDSQNHGWPLLIQLWNTPDDVVLNTWRNV